ncbi:fad binding domain protein [Lipomyces chichibuensis]|uniref:fad binding domain protein n=1 Tax=Lipomyces chichibuensis TaxID=1546026 RepID=UPI0033431A16
MTIEPALIDDLSSQLKDSKLLSPSSEGYAEHLKRWSNYAEKKAGAILLAESAADISKTVLFAQANSINIAVCGGGHSAAGSSSIDGGIVIDLSKMRGVVVDASNKTLTAQGGATWEDVDVAAAHYDLATVGGTVNHTGIGGLTLGGGHGWLTGKYGQVVDNLLSVKLVLADGNIVTASEKENSELFWAVRGAGQNFGVTVEFTYRLYAQPNPVWAGVLAFPPDRLPAVVQFANNLATTTRGEKAIEFGVSTPPPLTEPVIVAIVFYDGIAEEGMKTFEPLLSLEPIVNTATEMPYWKLNSILNAMVEPGHRRALGAATFFAPLDANFVQSIYDDFVDMCHTIPASSESIVLFEIIGRDKVCQVGSSAMAYANRGRYYNAVLVPKWHDSAFDSEMRAWSKKVANRIQNESGRYNTTDVGKYANYADFANLHVPVEALFGENTKKLQMLKEKYDPNNVFNKWHNLSHKVKV